MEPGEEWLAGAVIIYRGRWINRQEVGTARGIRKAILNEECQKVQRAAIQAEGAKGAELKMSLKLTVHESPLPAF